jgi:UDP-N-acetylmuramoyl-tripeptide--D-alanyl-D-alanine ligase
MPVHLIRDARNLGLLAGASMWRAVNRRTTFVALTGSAGKTTSRNCLGAILSSQAPTHVTEGNQNSSASLSRTILRTRPRHRYAVIEIGIDAPGQMRRWARAVAPHVAVVLGVDRTHPKGLPTLDVVAREKGRVLGAVRRGGVAVLNGDDPRVRIMAAPHLGRRVFFGDCPDTVARATNVRATLTEGLMFVLETPGGSRQLQLSLYGEHWVPAVLGAVATAHVLDVPLDDIQAGLATVGPHVSRCQPVLLPNGAVVIRDEHNGGVPSFLAALRFIRSVKARRRFLVMSEIRHLEDDPEARFRWVASQIRGAVEAALFVGAHANIAARAAGDAGLPAAGVHAFDDLQQASAALSGMIGEGDVVLLRGRRDDRLVRVAYGLLGDVACRKTSCSLRPPCDGCDELGACDALGQPTTLRPLALDPMTG